MIVELIAIGMTYIWVRVDESEWYDPHVMPALFFRWFVFLVTAGVVANIYAEGAVMGKIVEDWYTTHRIASRDQVLNHLIGVSFLKILLIRGALFDPFWNMTKGHSIWYHKQDDKLNINIRWRKKVIFKIRVDYIDHPAFWILSGLGYFAVLFFL